MIRDEAPVAASQIRGMFHGPIIAAGGFTCETATAVLESGAADLVAFGRHFISNPDLPNRFRIGAPLTPNDRATAPARRTAPKISPGMTALQPEQTIDSPLKPAHQREDGCSSTSTLNLDGAVMS